MNMPVEPLKTASNVNKPLWAAVGVLGIAVLAMGATLIRMQTRTEEPKLATLDATVSAPMAAASVTPLPVLAPTPEPKISAALPIESVKAVAPKPPAAPVRHAVTAPKSIANHSTTPMSPPPPAGTAANSVHPNEAVNHPAAPVIKPICANCGTVESVTPIQRDGTAGGGGAIAGGVLGAVVGNQIGNGNGKALATILGAVGGGFAGNTVEKKMKKETVYEVQVHMEDGSTRTLEQATPASVGVKVIIEGNTLHQAVR